MQIPKTRMLWAVWALNQPNLLPGRRLLLGTPLIRLLSNLLIYAMVHLVIRRGEVRWNLLGRRILPLTTRMRRDKVSLESAHQAAREARYKLPPARLPQQNTHKRLTKRSLGITNNLLKILSVHIRRLDLLALLERLQRQSLCALVGRAYMQRNLSKMLFRDMDKRCLTNVG